MLKWIVRIIASVVFLLIATVAAFAGLPWLAVFGDAFGADAYRKHLDSNEIVLDLSAEDANFSLAADDINARYVIIGEMHGFALPQYLDVALITYLQEQGPPRWYLAEMTPSEAIAVNEYLAGGEDRYVRAVFDRFAQLELQWANQQFFEKLTKFRALNEALPPARQIRFIGIDLDRGGDTLELPEGTSSVGPNLADPSSARAINEALLAAPGASGSRYAAMKARLTVLAETPGFDDAHFVGLWGIFHASEAPINSSEPLGSWLQHDDAGYRGDVVSISTMCVGDCFNMMPAAALPAPLIGASGERYTWLPMGIDNPYFQRPKGIGDFIHALGSDRAGLYRLGGDESPYDRGDRIVRSSGYLVMMQPWTVSGTAAQMTDYLLVYRDTAPLHPWKGEAFDVSGEAAAAK